VGQVLGNRALVAAKTDMAVRAYQICGRRRAVTLRDYALTIDIVPVLSSLREVLDPLLLP